ncbi:MAG: Co2+/Mg2+ efflux protein ApaG, partial [Thalassobaculaceae bacterium]
IINQGDEVVRLETRTWSITDAKGVTQEVHGPGVVGEFPRLAPGETFAYTSGVPLSEPSGVMVGTYQMVSDNGDHFDIDIPAFSLDSPHSTRRLN